MSHIEDQLPAYVSTHRLSTRESEVLAMRNVTRRNSHQKTAELPIAAAGAQASIVKTTQMTERMTSLNLSFFLATRSPRHLRSHVRTHRIRW